jgi:hypothetical protein
VATLAEIEIGLGEPASFEQLLSRDVEEAGRHLLDVGDRPIAPESCLEFNRAVAANTMEPVLADRFGSLRSSDLATRS